MPYIEPSDVPGVKNAQELINELEAELALHFPCLATITDPEKLTLLKQLLVPVIRRWADVGTGITTSEATGPFSRSKSNGGGHVLWAHERVRLSSLCGQPVSGGALSQGCFPDPEPIDDLFVRRPPWVGLR